MSLLQYTSKLVANSIGLPCEVKASGSNLIVRPTGIDSTEGFHVEFRRHWMSADAVLAFGPYAKGLIRQMGGADSGARQTFAELATRLPKGLRLKFEINGVPAKAGNPESWPDSWEALTLEITRPNIAADEMDDAAWQSVIAELVLGVFTLSIALIGIEDCDLDDSALEGTPTTTLSTRYERKPIHRDIALRLHGHSCVCCKFNFADFYGEAGDGYIEVHHIEPISSAGAPYKLNPATDLVPVCSNCHSVLHRIIPPMHPDTLRGIIQKRSV